MFVRYMGTPTGNGCRRWRTACYSTGLVSCGTSRQWLSARLRWVLRSDPTCFEVTLPKWVFWLWQYAWNETTTYAPNWHAQNPFENGTTTVWPFWNSSAETRCPLLLGGSISRSSSYYCKLDLASDNQPCTKSLLGPTMAVFHHLDKKCNRYKKRNISSQSVVRVQFHLH